VKATNQEEQGHEQEGNALQHTQRARRHAQGILGVQGKRQQAGTGDEPEQEAGSI
jgi:hypothetical protein